MNVVILFWTRDTATPKLDRHLGAAEKHALPFLMTNATGWLYCVPFYFMGQRAGLLNWQDVLAIVVYVLGTVIHFTADLQKKRFKAKPELKGLGSTRVSGATAATRTISATCSSTLAGRCSPRIPGRGCRLRQTSRNMRSTPYRRMKNGLRTDMGRRGPIMQPAQAA